MPQMQPRIRINQAARQLGVSPSTLRTHEAEFGPILRNQAGQRTYSAEDLARIRRVLVPGEVIEVAPGLRILEPKGVSND